MKNQRSQIQLIAYLLGFSFLLNTNSIAQKIQGISISNNRVIINNDSFIIYAEVISIPDNRKARNTIYYYWFSNNSIKKTKGGFEGKLLHGSYTEFYVDKNLRVKGQFEKGIKKGTWKGWDTNGQLRELNHFKKKGKIQKQELFNEVGEMIWRGTYKLEKLHGVIFQRTDQGILKTKYRMGKNITRKKKMPNDSTKSMRKIVKNWFTKKQNKEGIDHEGEAKPENRESTNVSPSKDPNSAKNVHSDDTVKEDKKSRKLRRQDRKKAKITESVPTDESKQLKKDRKKRKQKGAV